ncbi:uncharacterized protein LOC110026447 [Phalaenopsis equestris]|uniref:uncharacterized protein LOC110026447 n=1 Tax=Phalaenopsis equestris TaxID=78828 RepID=UPI0009E32351|nr:uncharacterized protein LOC110026447 [Phalaenopsis equestris]XP_020583042.1 uncharacterized protein LOC110026447 [Phalaenopsis equestris]
METYSAITLWGYQETLEDLKNKLWTAMCELEEVKNNARDELRKKEENINQLLQLLKTANHERDEAKEQLQLLLNNLTHPNSVEPFSSAPFLQPESPQLLQAFGSSSLTDSENLTDLHNNQSRVSSPTVVDSLVEGASISPDLSIVNFTESCKVLMPQQRLMNVSASPTSAEDEVMKVLFDRFAKKPLPEKGGLLKAVIDAGPILDTLFVAGSLPRWRNPPPMKPLLVPPLSIISGDGLNSHNSMHHCSTGAQAATASATMAYYGVNGTLCKAKRPLMEHQQCLTINRQKSQ